MIPSRPVADALDTSLWQRRSPRPPARPPAAVSMVRTDLSTPAAGRFGRAVPTEESWDVLLDPLAEDGPVPPRPPEPRRPDGPPPAGPGAAPGGPHGPVGRRPDRQAGLRRGQHRPLHGH